MQPDYSTSSAPNAPAPDAASPNDGDHFTIKMSPGYQLYLIGCTAVLGLSSVPGQPGAFAVDFTKSPSVDCALGEEAKFTITIGPKDY